jgi:hypothetical protein
MVVGALGVGYLQGKGMLNKIPTIGGSRALTLALVGFALTRFTKNRMLRTAGVVSMVAGAFDWGRVQGGGVSGLEGDTEGDDYAAGDDAEGDDAEGDDY